MSAIATLQVAASAWSSGEFLTQIANEVGTNEPQLLRGDGGLTLGNLPEKHIDVTIINETY